MTTYGSGMVPQAANLLQVRVTIQVQICIPLAMGIAAFFAHQITSGIILLVLAGVAALAFYLW